MKLEVHVKVSMRCEKCQTNATVTVSKTSGGFLSFSPGNIGVQKGSQQVERVTVRGDKINCVRLTTPVGNKCNNSGQLLTVNWTKDKKEDKKQERGKPKAPFQPKNAPAESKDYEKNGAQPCCSIM
ncbi:uncharacterized protein LOC105421696 isoform X1 [Amborella trichopoda]|uniref:uncharacterized protein LOC105421696 isoform X1 n=1 Tax=Amborella trichopoda TaxID=13333 RepID=UPI0009BEBA56|nr:uncharacterized protein LOC105421696 isoform X1 [Amborella trichopoda]|eukprot:XP_020531258.1 uncharacterized protein LOC105421696 isoform X1 [Amborella trichopoda]